MTFPFFSLPLVVQREVLGKLDILDAFKFSLVSKEASSISRSTQKLASVCWLLINDRTTLQLSDSKNQLYIVVKRGRETSFQTDNGGIYIGEHEVILKEEREDRRNQLAVEYFNSTGTNQFNLMRPIWEQVWSLVRRKDEVKHEAFMDIGDSRLALKALVELSKNFNHVEIMDHKSEVTADQIRFLFETISCKEMSLEMNLPRNGAYSQPLKNEYLRLEHVDWISFEALLKSQMIELHVLSDSLSDAQLNAILKTWLQGGLPNLQQLEMEILPTAHSKDVILAGTPWVPFTERGKPNYSEKDRRFKIEKYHSGFDVRRADGMCATLVIDESSPWKKSIEFLVWKKEYQLMIVED